MLKHGSYSRAWITIIAALLVTGWGLTVGATQAKAQGCPLEDVFPGGGRGPSLGPREWYVSPRLYQPLQSNTSNPLSGSDWFVDCQWGEAWTNSRIADAKTQTALEPIRRQPIFKWFGPTKNGVYQTVSAYLQRVQSQAPGSLPLMVWSKMESGYCRPSGYQPPDPKIYATPVYQENVREFQRALQDNPMPVVVVIEPDQLASLGCLPGHARRSKLSRISYAIDHFSRLPQASLYVDAGASDWMGWKTMISYLRKVGVAKTRGFALNTTHYDWTANNRAYGEQMARRLNKHFIINTARNGNGPITPRLRAQGYEGGCNIPNAGLGPVPTTQTGSPWVDAYTWTLNPGFGDGPCRHGKNYQTDRVRWDTPLALQLARQASSRLGSGKIYYHS